ncbi:hypothetical protein NX794_14710 [Streptomyces sp. LP11]|uniref:HTH cro/C1-type domain-containing protein n=1 Tax=Streptomyces pyxinicus TaxID=2970331 RepID=A0ABT2B1R3_9ACTN|nr:hypothetical protein [Streptomyces sp. LP11]MCS0602454.1 hypothetical protein [Streptomyces sp. LP11]
MSTTIEAAPANRSWINKQFRSDVPPAKRALAVALQEVCRHITPDKSSRNRITQATAAAHLGCSESSLSRFLSGQSLPALPLVENFYKRACADAGGTELIGVTLAELRELHSEAEAEKCYACVGLTTEVALLKQQLQVAEAECSALREEVAQVEPLRRDLASQRAIVAKLKAAKAGLEAPLALHAPSAPLPVPRRRGDRQRTQNDVSAARQLAKQAGDLSRTEGPNVALTLLRQNTGGLSPQEMAALLLLLRRQRDDQLADDVIHIYGRDQKNEDILHATLALHERGATDDAGAMLRAALR